MYFQMNFIIAKILNAYILFSVLRYSIFHAKLKNEIDFKNKFSENDYQGSIFI